MDDLPPFSDAATGAVMRPQYMGRTMTTYPVSEPEMEHLSSLNAQVTVRFATASSLLALAAGIWTNALFAAQMTAAGELATKFVAPLLLLFAIGFAIGGIIARRNRSSTWDRIKGGAIPVHTVVAASGLVVSGSRPAGPG